MPCPTSTTPAPTGWAAPMGSPLQQKAQTLPAGPAGASLLLPTQRLMALPRKPAGSVAVQSMRMVPANAAMVLQPVMTMPMVPVAAAAAPAPVMTGLSTASTSAAGSVFGAGVSAVGFDTTHDNTPDAANAMQGHGADGDLMKLLDSLEDRMDLMAKISQAKERLQACQEQDGHDFLQDGVSTDAASAGVEATATISSVSPLHGGEEAHRLREENLHLWQELQDQGACIKRLMAELKAAQDQAVEAQQLYLTSEAQMKQLQADLVEERGQHEAMAVGWQAERDQLLLELRDAHKSAAVARVASRTSCAGMPTASMPTMSLDSRRVFEGEDFNGRCDNIVNSYLSREGIVNPRCCAAPWDATVLGANAVLSSDGYVASRQAQCSRQAAFIGSCPLQQQGAGWFFEVEVKETVEGWVGGMGLGVTLTSPAMLRRMPDKACRIPQTYMVGYWGGVFLDGKEERTTWQVDKLAAGARVGVLVEASSGDLHIFVDGALVVSSPGALQEHVAGAHASSVELYPVLDVFAATVSVALLPQATPPATPWKTAKEFSQPDSPTTSVVTVSKPFAT